MGASYDADWFTTSSCLLMSFSWHRFYFVDGWRMESITDTKKITRKGDLSCLRSKYPTWPRLVLFALRHLWCKASFSIRIN
jgi:hypothetical protein